MIEKCPANEAKFYAWHLSECAGFCSKVDGQRP